MANTAPHYTADLEAMSLAQLNAFVATNYGALQEYARTLAISKDQTNNGLTAASAQTTLNAVSMKSRLFGT